MRDVQRHVRGGSADNAFDSIDEAEIPYRRRDSASSAMVFSQRPSDPIKANKTTKGHKG
jgi:hypothetical protein